MLDTVSDSIFKNKYLHLAYGSLLNPLVAY